MLRIIARTLAVAVALSVVSGLPGTPVEAAGPMPIWQLPFEAGQRWQAGAPHTGGGNNVGVRGSLDFGPSGAANGRVVAVAAGMAFQTSCAGVIGVDHGNGWTSEYYHLTNVQTQLFGQHVEAGTYLGQAGTAAPC